MKKTEITCDNCGADLGDSGPMPAYRLTLASERRPQNGGFSYAVCVYPDLESPRHFCDPRCLKTWAANAWGVAETVAEATRK